MRGESRGTFLPSTVILKPWRNRHGKPTFLPAISNGGGGGGGVRGAPRVTLSSLPCDRTSRKLLGLGPVLSGVGRKK